MREAIRKFANNFMMSALLLALTAANAFAASNTSRNAASNVAGIRANGVANAFSVTNNPRVEKS
jgi:hypothetical protein